jgi:hypothetical protein
MKTARCRSCQAEVVWLKTRNGKNVPVDVTSFDPVEFELDPPEFDPKLHVAHFATCPQAAEHRKPR